MADLGRGLAALDCCTVDSLNDRSPAVTFGCGAVRQAMPVSNAGFTVKHGRRASDHAGVHGFAADAGGDGFGGAGHYGRPSCAAPYPARFVRPPLAPRIAARSNAPYPSRV